MRRFLPRALWIVLVAMAVVGVPARAQEAEKAAPKERSFWESLQDRSRSMLHDAEGAVEEAGKAALKEAQEDYFPILRQAGYEVSEIRLTFALSPTVELRVVRVEKLSDEERQELLAKYEKNAKATGILETVFAAEKVEAEGLELRELIVTVGLNPRATVVLSPLESLAPRHAATG